MFEMTAASRRRPRCETLCESPAWETASDVYRAAPWLLDARRVSSGCKKWPAMVSSLRGMADGIRKI